MGSTNCTNYTVLIAKRIFALGRTSIEDIMDFCLKKIEMYNSKIERTKNERKRNTLKDNRHEYTWHTSESEYMDEQISSGIEIAMRHLYEQEIIRPVLNSENYSLWMKYMEHDSDDWDKFDKIEWIWQTGGRMKYINKEIDYTAGGG